MLLAVSHWRGVQSGPLGEEFIGGHQYSAINISRYASRDITGIILCLNLIQTQHFYDALLATFIFSFHDIETKSNVLSRRPLYFMHVANTKDVTEIDFR